jgi:hypothetical protein
MGTIQSFSLLAELCPILLLIMTGLDPVIFASAKKMPAASAGMMRRGVITQA